MVQRLLSADHSSSISFSFRRTSVSHHANPLRQPGTSRPKWLYRPISLLAVLVTVLSLFGAMSDPAAADPSGEAGVSRSSADVEPLAGPGVAVTDIFPRKVWCKNLTTGQKLSFEAAGASTWNCADAGLVVNPGDRVATRVRGPSKGSVEVLGGSVVGIRPAKAGCTNNTTEQHVEIVLDGATSWDCEAAGLLPNFRDRIQMSVRGKGE